MGTGQYNAALLNHQVGKGWWCGCSYIFKIAIQCRQNRQLKATGRWNAYAADFLPQFCGWKFPQVNTQWQIRNNSVTYPQHKFKSPQTQGLMLWPYYRSVVFRVLFWLSCGPPTTTADYSLYGSWTLPCPWCRHHFVCCRWKAVMYGKTLVNIWP